MDSVVSLPHISNYQFWNTTILWCFFKSLELDLSLSRAVTSEIFAVYMVLSSLFTILGGWVLGRYKPKYLFAFMGLAIGIDLLLTSQASELWHMFISYSFIFAIGSGPIWILSLSMVSRWFRKQRGLALSIVASGAGIGQMIMTPTSAWLVAEYGWQETYFILVIGALFITIPCALLLKGAPSELTTLPDLGEFNAINLIHLANNATENPKIPLCYKHQELKSFGSYF
ncbi:nitrate/nitrite transporter [Chloroflexota bacterium]